jgi:hypothetical protein
MHDPALITRLIHENCSTVIMFAFGQPPARDALTSKFKGEWKYLSKIIYEVSEQRADRALLELATQLRALDNKYDTAEVLQTVFGKVIQGDGSETPLYFRDMTNKIIHGAEFKWDFRDRAAPRIISIPSDPARWQRAEIEVVALMALSGQIMF